LSLNSWIRPEFNFDDHFDNLSGSGSPAAAGPAFDPFLDYSLLGQDPLLEDSAGDSPAPFLDYTHNPFRDSFNPFAENAVVQTPGNDNCEASNACYSSNPKPTFQEISTTKYESAAKKPKAEAVVAAVNLEFRNQPINLDLANLDLRNPSVDGAVSKLEHVNPLTDAAVSNLELQNPLVDAAVANLELRNPPVDAAVANIELRNPPVDAAVANMELRNPPVDATVADLELGNSPLDGTIANLEQKKY